MVIVLYALTALLYGTLAWAAWARRGGLEAPAAAGAIGAGGHPPGGTVLVPPPPASAGTAPGWWRWALLGALCAHGLLLHETIFPPSAMVFGFAYALSAMLWLGVGIFWIESLFFSLAGLGLLVMPVALVGSLLPLAFPGAQILGYAASPLFKLHFAIANMAYGLFTLAAFHAILMLAAERRLHTMHRPAEGGWLSRWLDLLPPLLTLEKLLFRLIGAGFVLLTLTIASGVLFSEQLFHRAVHFDHKNVFAVLSWLMFGGILIGRHFYGWRGRVALRWVMAAFAILLLAYVGSRFVLEVILHRT